MTAELLYLDYSMQVPPAESIEPAGYLGVMRYLSKDAKKNLSVSERDALRAKNLKIGLVWETYATRASEGFLAGQADALSAQAQANALGYPSNCTIFFAVDFPAQPGVVTPYFQGVKSVLHNPAGVYGSIHVVDEIMNAGLAVEAWQAEAWSGDAVSSHASLYQRIAATVAHPIPGTDENKVIGAGPTIWGHDVPPAPAPHITPAPQGHPAPGPHLGFPLPGGYYFGPSTGGKFSVSGRYHRLFVGHYDYWWLQQFAIQLARRGWNLAHYLPSGNDGVYGPEFAHLIGDFQVDQKLHKDDEAGPATWHAAFENPIS